MMRSIVQIERWTWATMRFSMHDVVKSWEVFNMWICTGGCQPNTFNVINLHTTIHNAIQMRPNDGYCCSLILLINATLVIN